MNLLPIQFDSSLYSTSSSAAYVWLFEFECSHSGGACDGTFLIDICSDMKSRDCLCPEHDINISNFCGISMRWSVRCSSSSNVSSHIVSAVAYLYIFIQVFATCSLDCHWSKNKMTLSRITLYELFESTTIHTSLRVIATPVYHFIALSRADMRNLKATHHHVVTNTNRDVTLQVFLVNLPCLQLTISQTVTMTTSAYIGFCSCLSVFIISCRSVLLFR